MWRTFQAQICFKRKNRPFIMLYKKRRRNKMKSKRMCSIGSQLSLSTISWGRILKINNRWITGSKKHLLRSQSCKLWVLRTDFEMQEEVLAREHQEGWITMSRVVRVLPEGSLCLRRISRILNFLRLGLDSLIVMGEEVVSWQSWDGCLHRKI